MTNVCVTIIYMSKRERLNISVVIPFKDKSNLTLIAIRSFIKYGPSVKEFLLVSNNSSTSELDNLRNSVQSMNNVTILEYNQPFNYQKINNWAISQAKGKFILMMNNDIELDENSTGLVERMYKKASQQNVGVCGATLLYGDKKHIQHAGVFLFPEGMAEHMYITKSYKNALAQAGSDKFPYDIRKDIKMTAVTGAFQLVEKEKFDSVGGMDERFIITGGDVDLCIRMNHAGYQTWFIGDGYAIHKESMSRRHIPISYNDFYYSYLSYITAYNPKIGDPFLPKVTAGIKIWGA